MSERRIVAYLLSSIDGVIEEPQHWVFDRFDAGMRAFLADLIARQDAVLLGRRTYEIWAPFWPTSRNEPFATFINRTPKYVVTSTLTDLAWQNSRRIDPADLRDAVAGLKAQGGGEIGVHGSGTLVRSLIQMDLLDELILATFPVVVGRGARLAEDLAAPRRMRLARWDRTESGVAIVRYEPQVRA